MTEDRRCENEDEHAHEATPRTPLTSQDALRLLEGVYREPVGEGIEGIPPFLRRDAESLGIALGAQRKALGWTSRRMASELGVEYETFLRWKADADLPRSCDVPRLCAVLGRNPTRVLRLIAESARRILERALTEAAGAAPRLLAARTRGEPAADEDLVLVTNIPPCLRRGLAERADTTEHDVPGLARALRHIAGADEKTRLLFVSGMAASLLLEGEEPWRC